MDSAQICVTGGGVLLIALTLWFFLGKRDDVVSATVVNDQALYECPMHPWITSTNAGANCSVCGMKIIRCGDAAPQHHGTH